MAESKENLRDNYFAINNLTMELSTLYLCVGLKMQWTPMHSNSISCTSSRSPLGVTSDMHLEPVSKKQVIFTLLKLSKNKQHSSSISVDLKELDL